MVNSNGANTRTLRNFTEKQRNKEQRLIDRFRKQQELKKSRRKK